MSIKTTAKTLRDSLQQGIYCVINPFVRFMIRIGVTPNMVTTIGFLGNVAAACILVYAGWLAVNDGFVSYNLLTLAGCLIIGFSIFDMLDGQVARLGNMASVFGAMYDSVLDRYCELFTLGGVIYYFMEINNLLGALITFLALVGSIMVSYVRARAEGLGIECKIGFMQRPERVVVLTLGVLITGIVGQSLDQNELWPNYILFGAVTLIAIFANLTACARISHCKRQLKSKKL